MSVKPFRSYEEQVELLVARGLVISDKEAAASLLRQVNYYRLSGYWYPFRVRDATGISSDFCPGTTLETVVALYEFDAQLRSVTFEVLAPIELAFRTMIGHELGRIDSCAHLDPTKLGPVARHGDKYRKWISKHREELSRSREEFIAHHQWKYGGRLPVWVAVELLDWGGLSKLYEMCPTHVRDTIADTCSLTSPQLGSWLKVLNVVRNTCAHHGRLFNRKHSITPKLPPAASHPELRRATVTPRKTFAQLSLIQQLLHELKLPGRNDLPQLLKQYPTVPHVPLAHVGAPPDWQDIEIWQITTSP